MRTAQEWLQDIRDQIVRIEHFTLDGRDAFFASEEKQYAVMLAYVLIGEALKNLPERLLTEAPAMDWRKLKGFRDYLIHNYHRVNPDRVWEAVEDLPALRTAVAALLRVADIDPHA